MQFLITEDDMATKKRLGELLLEAELITQDELDEALKLQVGAIVVWVTC